MADRYSGCRNILVKAFLTLSLTFISSLFGSQSFADSLLEHRGQKTCQSLFSSGYQDDELRSHLLEITKQTKGSAKLLDSHSTLDHTILGPEGREVLDKLNQLMVGHEEVKLALARAVQRGATGTKSSDRPVATILLLGVTGTGKTLAAEALAQAITNDPTRLVTINGGEMQENHEIARITGAPAGYIGHGDTSLLVTQKILDHNTSNRYKVNVVLVDELEKASVSLQRLLLGVMDKGRMTTGTNDVVDFSHTILILTSNLGQAEMNTVLNDRGPTIGFTTFLNKTSQISSQEKKRRIEEAAINATKKSLSPEFRNRIDKTFVFKELSAEESQKVLNMNLAAVQRKSFFLNSETRIMFSVAPNAREFILVHGYEPEFGGRSIRRTIEHLITEPLTNLVASKQIKSGDLVEVNVASDGNSLIFRKVAEDLSTEQQQLIYSKIYGNEVPPINAEAHAKYDTNNFLAHLDTVSDTKKKMNLINDFLEKSPVFGAREFLELYKRLPYDTDWGRKESTLITTAMKRAGYGDWKNLNFEPFRFRFIWQGMMRIKTLPANNRQQMHDLINQIEAELREWLSKEPLKEEFKNDLLGFVLHIHDQVMKLPTP